MCVRSYIMCLEGPRYSSSERIIELTSTEGQPLTIACTATGSSPISYEFFKVSFYSRRSPSGQGLIRVDSLKDGRKISQHRHLRTIETYIWTVDFPVFLSVCTVYILSSVCLSVLCLFVTDMDPCCCSW